MNEEDELEPAPKARGKRYEQRRVVLPSGMRPSAELRDELVRRPNRESRRKFLKSKDGRREFS